MGNAKIYGSSPKNKVMEFAIRSWNVNQGKGPVKFFDKKTGQRITWDYGKKLPYKEVSSCKPDPRSYVVTNDERS